MNKYTDQEKRAMNLVMGSLLALIVVVMAGIPMISKLLPY